MADPPKKTVAILKITWMNLNRSYWEERYKSENLGWDIGDISTPLKAYIDQLTNKSIKILVPGAGNGYEVVYLFQKDFQKVFVADLARQPLENIKQQIPEIAAKQLFYGDFFDLPFNDFDLILEQTFFCALNPSLRNNYVEKMYDLLRPGGKIAGLFFDFPLTEAGPPFGGSKEEYIRLFSNKFQIKTLENSYNSIGPRAGKELFFIFEK